MGLAAFQQLRQRMPDNLTDTQLPLAARPGFAALHAFLPIICYRFRGIASALIVQGAGDFLDVEAFDDVVGPDIRIVFERHAAFEALGDFTDLVLEALQGG